MGSRCRRRSPRATVCHTAAHAFDGGLAVDLTILTRTEGRLEHVDGVGTRWVTVGDGHGPAASPMRVPSDSCFSRMYWASVSVIWVRWLMMEVYVTLETGCRPHSCCSPQIHGVTLATVRSRGFTTHRKPTGTHTSLDRDRAMGKDEKPKPPYRCPRCGSGSFDTVKMNRTVTEALKRCKGCGYERTVEVYWPGRSKRRK